MNMGDALKPWPLPSGTWKPSDGTTGFTLELTANGHQVSKDLSPEDIAILLRTGKHPHPDQAKAIYPPEFKYCSVTGDSLVCPEPPRSANPWVPPFGVLPVGGRTKNPIVRGLRQTMDPLSLHRRSERGPKLDPDAELPLPPPGEYEFFSVPAATKSPVLMALEAQKGIVYLWRPASKTWERLQHAGPDQLAHSSISFSRWRCEASCQDFESMFFLPTKSGLAVVRPDALGLSYQVNHHGGGPVVGAPVQFGESVWAPVVSPDRKLSFANVNINTGSPAEPLACSMENEIDWNSNPLHPPLAYLKVAIWPHATGQLMLENDSAGSSIVARFIPWPEGMDPVFEFGSVFFSRDGQFWQLCFDSSKDCYVYLQLGTERPEVYPATTPRLCTGFFNYRFATKYQTPPWREPEQGDDSGTDEVVLPLLESGHNSAVIGLRIETTQGIVSMLQSNDRMRVDFVLEDDTSQTTFYTCAVMKPWRMRVFIHEGRLWAYHPDMQKIKGWDLQP